MQKLEIHFTKKKFTAKLFIKEKLRSLKFLDKNPKKKNTP